MPNQSTEEQIKLLNDRIAELALIVSLKTREMDAIEKKYNDRLQTLNKYIENLHVALGTQPQEGSIRDVDLVEKLQSLQLQNESGDDFIIIPTKKVILTPAQDKTNPNEHRKVFVIPKETTHHRRKNITCSYCKETGHKRSQCPKILYGGHT
ncbi:hypothetical protein JL09_g1950 [Pichia kudriavzevii]|uniref:CCHC-type domain-containing protein n=1 Tax=Pichia kudriavzevii TaxID=4909 RepID=A0A099P431_PICKU|nr:hypothetical protein JL09_g1950 [Pichia kudriavzevii]